MTKSCNSLRAFILMLGAVAFLASCNNTQPNGNSDALLENTMGDSLELIGKTLLLKYSTGMMAEVSYTSPTTVHWVTLENGQATGEGDEAMDYQRLSGYQFFLSWIEADGTSVSQVVDLKGLTVTAFLTFADENGRGGRGSQLLQGGVELK